MKYIKTKKGIVGINRSGIICHPDMKLYKVLDFLFPAPRFFCENIRLANDYSHVQFHIWR